MTTSMTDAEFVAAIEACTLPHKEFTHRNHVRLAWLYLGRYGAAEADRRICDTILRYATSLGAATKFREDVTLAWMRRVEAAMDRTPATDFDTFITTHAELLSSKP
jgi:hypothetical protein